MTDPTALRGQSAALAAALLWGALWACPPPATATDGAAPPLAGAPAPAAVPAAGGAPAASAPALPAPQWVGANARGGQVTLSWIRDPRFASVRVYRSPAEAGGVFAPVGETRENTFTDASVALGSSYRYRLAAVGMEGKEGRASSELVVQIPAVILRPPQAPAWEGYLSLENGIGLKWSDQEGADIVVYNVYRREPHDTEYRLLASVRGTNYVDTGVAPERAVVYALTALDSSFRETPFSAALTVTYSPRRAPAERKEAPEWKARRTRLVALVTRGDEPLLRPADVAVGPRSGNVYLSDSGRNRIFVFGPGGDFVRSIGGAGPAAIFRRLLGIAVDGSETLYAVDAGQAAVFAFEEGAGAGRRLELPRPQHQYSPAFVDCVSGADGRLYAVDNSNNRVLVSGGGSAAGIIGATGFGPGEFSAPTFSAVDGSGSLYVSDTLNGRVQVFSAAGELLRSFGRQERGALLLGRPKGLAIRDNGEVLVADSWLNFVGVFDASGQPQAVLVDEEGKPLDLGSPNGVALGPGNRVYIAERLSARLQIREIIDEAR